MTIFKTSTYKILLECIKKHLHTITSNQIHLFLRL